MTLSLASLFDLNGSATRAYAMDASTGDFRSKFGSLFETDNQKRLAEYTDNDIARVNSMRMHQLEQIQQETVDPTESNLVAGTGNGRNRAARSVGEQFTPMANNLDFRLQAGPIRA